MNCTNIINNQLTSKIRSIHHMECAHIPWDAYGERILASSWVKCYV